MLGVRHTSINFWRENDQCLLEQEEELRLHLLLLRGGERLLERSLSIRKPHFLLCKIMSCIMHYAREEVGNYQSTEEEEQLRLHPLLLRGRERLLTEKRTD